MSESVERVFRTDRQPALCRRRHHESPRCRNIPDFTQGSLFLANKKRTVAVSPVAVEKLFLGKFAKIKLRQDAL